MISLWSCVFSVWHRIESWSKYTIQFWLLPVTIWRRFRVIFRFQHLYLNIGFKLRRSQSVLILSLNQNKLWIASCSYSSWQFNISRKKINKIKLRIFTSRAFRLSSRFCRFSSESSRSFINKNLMPPYKSLSNIFILHASVCVFSQIEKLRISARLVCKDQFWASFKVGLNFQAGVSLYQIQLHTEMTFSETKILVFWFPKW